MNSQLKYGISIISILILVLFGIYYQTRNEKTNSIAILPNNTKLKVENEINIATVVCGGKHRARFSLPLIKSAIMFSETNLNIHLFTDISSGNELKLIYSKFNENIKRRVKFIFYNASFPQENHQYWKNLYKSCATQRIFYPNIITDVNEIIHFDADMIILTKLENIWKKFKEISETEILGAANDCGTPSCVYFDKTRLPLVVDKYGVNSGLLFMKLDDLRRFDFVKKIIEIRKRSKFRIIGDQDMINILFYNQTDLIRRFDCTYNYFPNVYCNNIDECDLTSGIKVVHGVMSQFEYNKDSVFYTLAHKLIDIDLNRDPSEAIRELITDMDNHDHFDACVVTKPFLFKDYRNDNSSFILL